MKTLNLVKPITFVLLSFFVLTSACKKNSPVPPIVGKWVGTYTKPEVLGVFYLSFNIKADGTLEVMNDENNKDLVAGTGSWTLNAKVFETEITYKTSPMAHFLYIANFDNDTGTLSAGTLGLKPSNSNNGTWQMTKQ